MNSALLFYLNFLNQAQLAVYRSMREIKIKWRFSVIRIICRKAGKQASQTCADFHFESGSSRQAQTSSRDLGRILSMVYLEKEIAQFAAHRVAYTESQ